MKTWASIAFLLAACLLSAQDAGQGGYSSSPDYDPELDFTLSPWNQFSYPEEILQLMKESLLSADHLRYLMEHNARQRAFALAQDLQEDLRVMREVSGDLERQLIFWRIAAIVFAAACLLILLSLVLLRNVLASLARELRESVAGQAR